MQLSNGAVALSPDIATPPGNGGVLAGLASGQKLPALAASIGATIGSLLGHPIRIGTAVIAARHADVLDMLARDLDFRIAPINEAKIDAVNGGPFVLGMDRGLRLAREREALYLALANVDLHSLQAARGARRGAASRYGRRDARRRRSVCTAGRGGHGAAIVWHRRRHRADPVHGRHPRRVRPYLPQSRRTIRPFRRARSRRAR